MAIIYTWKQYKVNSTAIIDRQHFQTGNEAHRAGTYYNKAEFDAGRYEQYAVYGTATFNESTLTVTLSNKLHSSTDYNTILNYVKEGRDVYLSNTTTFTVSASDRAKLESDPYAYVKFSYIYHPWPWHYGTSSSFSVYGCGIDNIYHIERSMGDYITDVTSTDSSAYPSNGISGDYWYVYQGTNNTAPTTPGTPSFTSEITGGDTITVSWSASSDLEDNLSGYQLEVSGNGGGWISVYRGSSTSTTYTVPSGVSTIAFRVRAYDSLNAYSSYATSATVPVTNNSLTNYGYATIGGINKSLTGLGYVNVNGVWKPTVRSFWNYGGVWKSTLTGASPSDSPDGYTQIEYIESTGTQWIDTGVGGSNNAYFEIDFLTKNVVGPSSTDFGTILGAFSGSTLTRLNLGTWNSSSATTGGEMCWGRNTYNPYITSNKRIQISLVYVSGQGARFITPNGTVAASTSSYTTGSNIGIFCRNYNGIPDQFSKVRLYSLKLYNGASTVVRDFVPCVNTSAEVGLWDKIEGKFYGNNGTGYFIAGN